MAKYVEFLLSRHRRCCFAQSVLEVGSASSPATDSVRSRRSDHRSLSSDSRPSHRRQVYNPVFFDHAGMEPAAD